MSAGEVTDATDAVVYCGIVPMTPIHFQLRAHFGIFARGVVGRWFTSANPEWIFRVEVLHAMIFNINAGHAIIGRRKQETIFKSYFQRTRLEFSVPVRSPVLRQALDATFQPRRSA